MWTQTHGGEVGLVGMGGLALLPGGGGLLVAGTTNVDVDSSDGLLVWYDLDGGQLADDVVLDLDDVDALHDVAVTPYNYAVAVGVRMAAGCRRGSVDPQIRDLGRLAFTLRLALGGR